MRCKNDMVYSTCFSLKAERKKEREKDVYFLKTAYTVNTCLCFRFNCTLDSRWIIIRGALERPFFSGDLGK